MVLEVRFACSRILDLRTRCLELLLKLLHKCRRLCPLSIHFVQEVIALALNFREVALQLVRSPVPLRERAACLGLLRVEDSLRGLRVLLERSLRVLQRPDAELKFCHLAERSLSISDRVVNLTPKSNRLRLREFAVLLRSLARAS